MGEKHTTRTPEIAPCDAPPADGSAELRAQIAALAEQVRRLSVRDAPTPAPVAHDEPQAVREQPPAIDVIAMAERTAEEIRESARLEARRIRAERSPPNTDLAAVLRRQRATLAVLAAETERLEQSAEILRSQVRALEGELARLGEIIGATSRSSSVRALNAPDASPGTSPRRRG